MKVFSNRHKSLSGLTTKSSNTNTGQQIRIMTEETSQGSLPAAWRVSYCLDKSSQTTINFTGIYLRLGKEKHHANANNFYCDTKGKWALHALNKGNTLAVSCRCGIHERMRVTCQVQSKLHPIVLISS